MSESAGEWQTVWYIIGEWKWQFDWMRWECHNVHILHCSLTLSAINALRFLCANFSVPHSPRACNTHDRKKAAIRLRHFDDMFYIIIDTHQNIAWRVNKELIPDQITSFYIEMLRIRHKLVTNSAVFFRQQPAIVLKSAHWIFTDRYIYGRCGLFVLYVPFLALFILSVSIFHYALVCTTTARIFDSLPHFLYIEIDRVFMKCDKKKKNVDRPRIHKNYGVLFLSFSLIPYRSFCSSIHGNTQ